MGVGGKLFYETLESVVLSPQSRELRVELIVQMDEAVNMAHDFRSRFKQRLMQFIMRNHFVFYRRDDLEDIVDGLLLIHTI